MHRPPTPLPEPVPQAAPLVSVRGLSVAFVRGRAPPSAAVRDVSFDIPAHSTVALVGESGSGKSVSAMSIARLLPANAVLSPASQVLFQGRNLLELAPQEMRALRGREISFVFQEPMTSLNPVMTVGEQIAEVLRIHQNLPVRQALERAAQLLDEVGIAQARQRLRAYPHELSGGQQQRVMIAIAIACEPKLLIADEPTTALDVTVQRQVMDLLARLQQKHRMSLLLISHDLALVGEVAQQVVVMRQGQVREVGSTHDLFTTPQDAYTRALLACRPRLDQRPRRLPVIEDFMQGTMHALGERAPKPAQGAPLVQVQDLRKVYQIKQGLFKRHDLVAVQGADFALHRGRTLGVVGESGSGKTTLGMMLTRLIDPSAGHILFEGQDLAALGPAQLRPMRRRLQIIFQNPYASLNPRFTVGQILTEPLHIHGLAATEAERTRMAQAWLARVGLPADAMGKYPHEFSGGQRQRIAIARCLTMQPEIIVCDESVSALDVSVQATVLNLLLDLQEEFGLSYVFISHDLAVVKYMADEILVMSQGQIVERGDAQQLYAQPQHPYTRQLLAAIPRGLSH